MKLICEETTPERFTAMICDINIDGVSITCTVECGWELVDSGYDKPDVEIATHVFTFSDSYEFIVNGAWHKEIMEQVEEQIEESINIWQEKQWEEEREQGGC